MKRLIFKKNGVTLVELLIALGILTLGIVAALGLLTQSLGFSRIVSDRYVANFLAIEGIEVVKNVIDNNSWGAVSAGTYEVEYNDASLPFASYTAPGNFLRVGADGFYGYDSGTGSKETRFKRRVVVSYPDDCGVESRCADHARVNAIVDWTSLSNIDFSIDVEDHFFNWKQ